MRLKNKIFLSEDIYFDNDRESIISESGEILLHLTREDRLIIKCLCLRYDAPYVDTETIAEYVYGTEQEADNGKGKSIVERTTTQMSRLKAKKLQNRGIDMGSIIHTIKKKGRFKIQLLESESPFEEEQQSIQNPISDFCKSHGIINFYDQGNDMRPFLQDKNIIYIASTTAGNLISSWERTGFLVSKLIEGTNFYILIANKHSELADDVVSIENRKFDLASEFERVIKSLCSAVIDANNKRGNHEIGKIYIGCCFSLLRQTITLGIGKNGQAWGWLSLTLPPSITVSGTTSFAFEGNITEEHTFPYDTYHHIQALIKEAKAREGTWIEVTPEINPNTFYFRERYPKGHQPVIREQWEQKADAAQLYMRSLVRNTSMLIEVAAQHPLESNGGPAKEFKLRLDYAAELYRKLKEKHDCQVHIYIPGSIHKPDNISLSEAGKRYLIRFQNISGTDIIGDEANRKYKKEQGVYNSADECFVASEIFKNGSYCKIYSICSPNQVTRKQLFYIQFGVLPMFYTVSLDPIDAQNASHDLLYEVFEALPDVLYRDHDWQNPESLDAIRTRKDRMPGISEIADGLDSFYSSKAYIDRAVEVCERYYSGFELLRYGNQIFPDIAIPASKELRSISRAALQSNPKVLTRDIVRSINIPNKFILRRDWKEKFQKYKAVITETMIPKAVIQKRVDDKMTHNSIGYSRYSLDVNNNGELEGIQFCVCDYRSNMIDTEALTWEIKESEKTGSFPLRDGIIAKTGQDYSIFNSGEVLHSMVGTQCVIVFKGNDPFEQFYSDEDSYRTLLIQRSDEVCEKNGSYQFAGCGSFTVRDQEDIVDELIEKGFNLISSFSNEYSGEIFADESVGINGQSSKSHLAKMMEEGTASWEILGVSASLDTLKTDLVLLILIEDEDYCHCIFNSNFESKNKKPYSIPISKLQEFLIGNELLARELVGPIELLKKSNLLKEKGIVF